MYSHLKGFRAELTARNAAETGIRYEWYALQRWGAEYWQEFEQPKIVVAAIAEAPNFAPDVDGHYTHNKCTIFFPARLSFALGVLNSSVNAWFSKQVCASKQGGFYDFDPRYSGQLLIPQASSAQISLVEGVVAAVLNARANGFEQLINGLVYELFFPEDLHAAGIRLFDACVREHIVRLATRQGAALQTEAEALAERIFSNSHPIYAMLFDLQALNVVRIIEERD